MRKNWTMRAGVLMLALTLITSCFVGGTFAKYVTDGNSTDTARVAKFGVKVTGEGDAFSTSETNDEVTFSVKSSTEDNVVAPGTTGNLASSALTGEPEVAVEVKTVVETFDVSNWTVDGKFYCPLTIKIGEADNQKVNGLSFTDETEFENAVKTLINGAVSVNKYSAGTNLANETNNNVEVTWEWPFSNGTTYDINDTKLGDQAADNIDNAGKIEISIKTTVTQID